MLRIAYHGDTLDSLVFINEPIHIQLAIPPAIKNQIIFDDSLFVFYNDTLRSKVKLNIAKTKGTCFDVYKLSKVAIDDSIFCTSNCTNRVYPLKI